MRFLALQVASLLMALQLGAQSWVLQDSGVTASLRGVHAVSSKVVWASGSDGTWLRTLNGGGKWETGKVTGGEKLDFRGIQAFSATEAIVVSAGAGPLSKVYSTSDGGTHWQFLFENPDDRGFFDGVSFSDRKQGAILGDPVSGRLTVFVTADGGRTWTRCEGPEAHEGEASFAASNSTLRVLSGKDIRIASGGKGGARVIRSADGGTTWSAVQTPLRHDLETAGIFSVGWKSASHGIAVGGNYQNDKEGIANLAITLDGGRSWKLPAQGPAGFRSAVEYLKSERVWIATGTSGSDISPDGRLWRQFDDGAFHALSGGWATGPKGRIGKLQTSLPR